jgi:hypothetical protein
LLIPKLIARRLGPVAVAWTLYDVWKRLPAHRRAQLSAQAADLAKKGSARFARIRA